VGDNLTLNPFVTYFDFNQAQSVFHVLYLFPFSNGGPRPASYPKAPPPVLNVLWPTQIKKWADGIDLDDLGSRKRTFFMMRPKWHPNLNKVLREPPHANQQSHLNQHWSEESLRFNLWDRFITELHDRWLWFYNERAPVESRYWDPVEHLESVLDLVEGMQHILGMALTFHAQNINHVQIQTLDVPSGAYDVPSRRNDG
jgi:hypothetical protein